MVLLDIRYISSKRRKGQPYVGAPYVVIPTSWRTRFHSASRQNRRLSDLSALGTRIHDHLCRYTIVLATCSQLRRAGGSAGGAITLSAYSKHDTNSFHGPPLPTRAFFSVSLFLTSLFFFSCLLFAVNGRRRRAGVPVGHKSAGAVH